MIELTGQLGDQHLLHDGGQQVDIHVSGPQGPLLLTAVEQQRLEPQHVLKVGTLRLPGKSGLII